MTMTSSNDKSIIWYTQYDPNNPPSKPSDAYVRFVVLSDTHSTEPAVPDGDVLLHSGDLTDMGTEKAIEKQLAWLSTLPHPFKYIIAGNHDFALCSRNGWYESRGRELHKSYRYEEANVEVVKKLVQDWQTNANGKVHRYLEDEQADFTLKDRRWTIYGSPWTPEFGGWAWNHKRGKEAKKLYADLPSTDILLTHGPPHDIGNLDVLSDGTTHVGCEELTEKLHGGAIKPLIHAFGHIHEAQGVHLDTATGSDSTLFINSAIVEFDMPRFRRERSLHYKVVHQPIVVDIDPSRCRQHL